MKNSCCKEAQILFLKIAGSISFDIQQIPQKLKDGLAKGHMLFFIRKWAHMQKFMQRIQDWKILSDWDFTSPWLAKIIVAHWVFACIPIVRSLKVKLCDFSSTITFSGGQGRERQRHILLNSSSCSGTIHIGHYSEAPLRYQEGVISDPMLLKSIFYYVPLSHKLSKILGFQNFVKFRYGGPFQPPLYDNN